jgi:periplasmic divalent cation tolerance protein
VLVTCPSEVSEKIAKTTLDERVAACVNIITRVKSIYRWKGKIETASECLLLIKTRTASLDKLRGVVKNVHPYDVPEILAVPITHGNRPYLEWIEESTKSGGRELA